MEILSKLIHGRQPPAIEGARAESSSQAKPEDSVSDKNDLYFLRKVERIVISLLKVYLYFVYECQSNCHSDLLLRFLNCNYFTLYISFSHNVN